MTFRLWSCALLAVAACGDNLPGNAAPTISDQQLSTLEDTALQLDLGAVDASRDTLTFTLTTPAHGTLSGTGNTRTYTPAANYSGADTFDVSVSDGEFAASATVTITVTAVNDPPIAADDSFAATEDVALDLEASVLLANDEDVDGQLTLSEVGAATGGTVTLDAGQLHFVPTADFVGDATFSYTVTDGELTAAALVTISVGGVNDPPVAVADEAAGTEDTELMITAAELLANDADPDGQTLSVTSVGDAIGGVVSLDAGTIRFAPTADLFGAASFSYAITDGVATATATVALTIAAVDDPPVASATSASTTEDAAIGIPLTASDVDSATLTYEVVSPPAHGMVSILGNIATYVPALNYYGGDEFAIAARDATSASAPVTVTVDISNVVECGDGVLEGTEACDDGNADNTDACLNTCAVASCGDGAVQTGVEQCDDGNAIDTDACRNTCTAAYCGDGVVEAGVEQCDDGNTIPDDACDNMCVLTIPPVCGDGVVGGSEECDDGNTADQDGCSGACVTEFCGDGAVQYGLGEVCDDGNTADGDGCDSTCQLEGGFVTVPPVLVSGALSCQTTQSNTGRKVAVDSLGYVYVVMTCGGEAYVAISVDRGVSYAAPVALGITNISEIAIAAGPPGVAYVAASGSGTARFTRTDDAGATWSAPIDLTASTDFEISIEAFNDDVFIGVGGGSGVVVLYNGTRGVGAFTSTDVAISQAFFDVIYDDRQNTLLVCSDTPDFHIRVSDDRGATFGAEVNPGGLAFYSDWTVGNGTIFVAGTSSGDDQLILIPTDAPGTSTSVPGIPNTNQSSQRTLSADANGNAYVATTLDSGAIQLDRLPVGTTTFSPPRTIAPAGSYPAISALPTSTGAAMAYGDGAGQVFATVQVY